MWGETLTPKNANYDSFYPIFFSIFTPKFANFCNFSPKNANLDNFSPKKCNFEKFSTSESEKYGEFFSQIFCRLGKRNFGQNIHLCLLFDSHSLFIFKELIIWYSVFGPYSLFGLTLLCSKAMFLMSQMPL